MDIELESLIYEVEHNSCKKIGEERYKRINQRIGYLRARQEHRKEIKEILNKIIKDQRTVVKVGKKAQRVGEDWYIPVTEERKGDISILKVKRIIQEHYGLQFSNLKEEE